MAKVRIHTWAKANKKSSIEVVQLLNAKGHNVRNQTMPVDENILNSLYENKPAASTNKPKTTNKERNYSNNRNPRNNQSNKKKEEPKFNTYNRKKPVNTEDKKVESNDNNRNYQNRQGDNRQGGYQNRQGDNRQGGYQNRQGDNRQGGYQNRQGDNRQGGYQNRQGDNRQGGYQNRQGDNRQGGYQNRQGDNRQGGYQNRQGDNRQGGYQNRQGGNRQGGYQNRQGGYQNRQGDNRQGGYQNRQGDNRQGGYQNRQGDNRQGGYQNRQGGNRQGGYQNRQGDNRQGGYQNRQGGYQNRNAKPAENTTIEQKPSNNKKRPQQRKTNSFDKFKQFDRENSRAFDGKTKTQLKKEARQERQEALKKETSIIKWTEDMTVSSFAQALNIPASDITMKLFQLGIMATINQQIDKETAEVICTEFNAEIVEDDSNSDLEFETLIPEFDEEQTSERPPIVTIMGHVDHGKTTLLDTLRNANVTSREAGGITQHIGAYQIDKDGFKVTFLDTPGHAAFTAMRARGANVTDITILVVAADDGVMPQTKEAVAHAKEANSPLIVAVNKMDKQDANPDRVMSELAELGVMSEEWGGETPFVKISALNGEGLDELIDYVKVLSELHEFKAPYEVAGFGTVIEANLDRGRGPVATILMQGGYMSLSDSIVIGDTWGSVRVMQDEYGTRHKKIGPSMPVEITGLKDVPQAGDQFVVMDDAKQAQLIGEKRASIKAQKDRNSSHALSLEELNAKIAEGEVAELPVIIKADVQGSVEALAASLEKIEVNGVKVRVVHRGVGGINESDVSLATASNAIMIGFNVRPDANTRKILEKEKIELMLDNVIYNIIEKIEDAMNGLRATKTVETIVGYATVLDTFKITGVGKVAGTSVTSGKIIRSGKMRLLRDSVVIYDGEIGALKRYKDDAKEVIEGQECGISFANFDDVKVGDEFECYVEETEIV